MGACRHNRPFSGGLTTGPRVFRPGLEVALCGGDYGTLVAGADNANYVYLKGLRVWRVGLD